MTISNFRCAVYPSGVHIPVIGCIASGKTSFCRALAKAIAEDTGKPCRTMFEPATEDDDGSKNPFLAAYYKDVPRWAFTIQIYLLNKRLEQTRLAQAMAMNGENSVADSSIWSDSIFVCKLEKSGDMTHDEADCYFELFHNMSREIMYPQCFVYLDVSPDTSMRRLAQRISEKEKRKCESSIPRAYMEGLIAEYRELTSNLSRFSHVITLDWNKDRTPDEIDQEARNLWTQIKRVRDTMTIPCQITL
jgi:deoxyadenosine/deoxycytidine kinase